MKVLTVDIETAPNLAYVWSLWNQNVGLSQLVESSEVLCFAAKWLGEDNVYFYSKHSDGHDTMVAQAKWFLDEADVVITYNGKKFDIPHLNREILLSGEGPPSPYAQVDLYQVVRSKFRFSSNKLDHVAQQMGLGAKVSHSGFSLWTRCMAGDDAAWAEMEEYNRHDVVLTENLYKELVPWIPGHPNVGLYVDQEDICTNCGSEDVTRQGFAYTTVSVYQRYKCNDCGKWMRGNTRIAKTNVSSVK